MLSVKQDGIKYHFGMIRPGIEPRIPGLLANSHKANGPVKNLAIINYKTLNSLNF